jgi:sugar phosphate isomerase/epimerase
MKTCLAIQSLRSCTLEEAAGITRALGFEAMDLDGVMDTTLSRAGILKGDAAEVKRVQKLGLTVPNIHWTFGVANIYPAINDPAPVVRADNKEQIKRLAHFCHEADIYSILVLPGMFLPGQSAADAHKLSADSLNEFQIITNEAGVALMVEPHVTSAFESPESALWLAKQVPGMGIVLDYAHFVVQGYTQPEVDRLIPTTSHVHLRQAKSGLLQTRFEDGTINFAHLLDRLRQADYDGYLCVEYVHQDFIGATNVDVITETVKMRDFINAHL